MSETNAWKAIAKWGSSVAGVITILSTTVGGVVAVLVLWGTTLFAFFSLPQKHDEDMAAKDSEIAFLREMVAAGQAHDDSLEARLARERRATDFTVKHLLCVYLGYENPLQCPHFREEMAALVEIEDEAILLPQPQPEDPP